MIFFEFILFFFIFYELFQNKLLIKKIIINLKFYLLFFYKNNLINSQILILKIVKNNFYYFLRTIIRQNHSKIYFFRFYSIFFSFYLFFSIFFIFSKILKSTKKNNIKLYIKKIKMPYFRFSRFIIFFTFLF